MNNSEILYRLQRLKEEDLIWLVYFFIVTFAIISNYYERKYIINNKDYYAKKKFKNINSTIFIIAVLIYLYYLITADIDLNKSTKKNIYDNYLRYFGALLFFVAGCIYLYVDYHTNIEEVNIGII